MAGTSLCLTYFVPLNYFSNEWPILVLNLLGMKKENKTLLSPHCLRHRPGLRHQHPGRVLCLLRRGVPHRGQDSWPRIQLILGQGRPYGQQI